MAVDVKAVKPLPKPVTLATIKAEPKLKDMALVKYAAVGAAGDRGRMEDRLQDGRAEGLTRSLPGLYRPSTSFHNALSKARMPGMTNGGHYELYARQYRLDARCRRCRHGFSAASGTPALASGGWLRRARPSSSARQNRPVNPPSQWRRPLSWSSLADNHHGLGAGRHPRAISTCSRCATGLISGALRAGSASSSPRWPSTTHFRHTARPMLTVIDSVALARRIADHRGDPGRLWRAKATANPA